MEILTYNSYKVKLKSRGFTGFSEGSKSFRVKFHTLNLKQHITMGNIQVDGPP